VQQSGQEWVIESASGIQVSVHESDLLPGRTETNTRWDRDRLGDGTFTSILPDAIYSGEWVWVPVGDLIKKILSHRRLRQADMPAELLAMGPQNKVLALVTSVEGKTVHVVRAFDGEPLDVTQESVVGTTNGLQKTMSGQKSMGSWRLSVLEGHDPHIRPPGESHPMLTLGVGQFNEEIGAALEMVGAARITGSATLEHDGRIRTTVGDTGKVETREKNKLQDELDTTAFTNRERPAGVKSVRFQEISATPGGNGGTLVLVVGAAVCLYLFM
jgi:hypothetical protein